MLDETVLNRVFGITARYPQDYIREFFNGGFTVDDGAAMKVVDEMERRGYGFSIEKNYRYAGVKVRFQSSDNYGEAWDDARRIAICLAALNALGR